MFPGVSRAVVLRLEDEVEAAFPAMTDSQKRGAQFVVRNPEETAFETMHGWGKDRFMVRSFDAIDRLLWIVAL